MADTANDSFTAYTQRFERLIGNLQVGQYAHYKGRVIRRLDEAQHFEKYREYCDLYARFTQMIQTGDTIDDMVAADLRSAEIELVFEQSSFLPSSSK